MRGIVESVGGRKFIGFVVLLASGVAIEVYGKNGMSTTMAAYLAGLYTVFTAANSAVSIKAFGTATAATAPSSTQAEVTASNEELTQQVAGVLSQIGASLNQLQQGQARTEQALNIAQQSISTLQKATGALLSARQE